MPPWDRRRKPCWITKERSAGATVSMRQERSRQEASSAPATSCCAARRSVSTSATRAPSSAPKPVRRSPKAKRSAGRIWNSDVRGRGEVRMDSNKLVIFGSAELASLARFYFEHDRDWQVIAYTVDDLYDDAEGFDRLTPRAVSEVQNRLPQH